MEKKRVGIIGAGVSGLAACKHATDKGFRPVVFEAEPTIGGVWGRTIESTKLQAPASAYRFSDLPWPRNVTETYPNHEQVIEYILSYARQFGLFQHIKFDSKVVGIEFVGPSEEEIMGWESWAGNGEAFGCGDTRGTWLITTQNTNRGDSKQVFEVDFVILCVGRFSGVPNVPKFPAENGPEVFEGKVLHSMDYSSMSNADAAELIRGKRVVVVGSGKSAYDIAAECAKANGVECPCTMIYRTKHWFVHDNNVWGINLSHFYLTRFAELLIHKPGEGFLRGLFATLLFPLRWAISRIIEAYYTRKIPMEKHDMVPEYSFFHAMSSCSIAMLPEGFYSRVDEGSIVLKKSKTIRFSDQRGVILDGEDAPTIEADVVILATGFRGDQKLRDIFVSPWLQKIVAGPSNRTVPLYRECIHPRIPQLAIIGYSESLTNIYAAETMSRWVSHFLGGRFRLPSVRCMEEEVAEWEKYKKRYNMKYFRRSCVSTVNIWYNDMLCRDMGCDRKRKKGWFAEWFEPYGPADYAGLR